MQTEFLCIYVLRVTSGPRVKFAGRENVLNPQVLVILFVAL